MKYKLKPIPKYTVVHTPTEAEAKELLEILHENGYKWYCSGKEEGWENFGNETCCRIDSNKKVYHTQIRRWYETICQYCILPVLTLSEFKSKFVEEEKPMYKVGDRVRVLDNTPLVSNIGKIATIVKEGQCCKGYGWVLDISKSVFLESELKPYTEPTEENNNNLNNSNMQDDVKSDANKELNLCEILKGHEGEKFFSPCYGNVTLSEARDDRIIITANVNGKKHTLCPDGTHISGAVLSCVNLLPSVGLYQQYPLDPCAAWMKWQEEQKNRCSLTVDISKYDNHQLSGAIKLQTLYFRTPSDRDKCIEVIDAFLKQIQQSRSVASLCEELKSLIGKYSK